MLDDRVFRHVENIRLTRGSMPSSNTFEVGQGIVMLLCEV
jgi:hypothetical protein